MTDWSAMYFIVIRPESLEIVFINSRLVFLQFSEFWVVNGYSMNERSEMKLVNLDPLQSAKCYAHWMIAILN